MKRFIIGAGIVLAMLAQPAMAQSTGGTGTTGSSTGSTSSVSVVAVTGPTSDTPEHQYVGYNGHEWTTPSVQGSYFGGTNPCLVGTGGGVAGGPIGISINAGRSDEACTRRSDAAAWHAMGFDNIAVARMCQDTKNADAFFASTGLACPGTAGTRYRLTDGSPAPEMRLVSDAKALPVQARTAEVDFSNPEVRQAVMAQAKLIAEQMVAQRTQKQAFPQPTFTPQDRPSDAPPPATETLPGHSTGK